MDLITYCNFLTIVTELNDAIENNLSCCKKSTLEKSILYSQVLWLKEMGEDTCHLEKYLYSKFSCTPKNCSDTVEIRCDLIIDDQNLVVTCNGDLIINIIQ